jgi:hypothetical protein
MDNPQGNVAPISKNEILRHAHEAVVLIQPTRAKD